MRWTATARKRLDITVDYLELLGGNKVAVAGREPRCPDGRDSAVSFASAIRLTRNE